MRNISALGISLSLLLFWCVLAPMPEPVPPVVPYPTHTATATSTATVTPTWTPTVTPEPTATPTPPEVQAVVVGDTQFAYGNCRSGYPAQMPRIIATMAPDLLLTTGDNVDHGYEGYETFDRCYAPVLDAGIDLRPTSGNHDQVGMADYRRWVHGHTADEAVINCGDYEQGPNGANWGTQYAFVRGPVQFVSLEQGNEWWIRTPPEWLACVLRRAEENPAVRWVVIYGHGPMYSSIWTHPHTEPIRRELEPLWSPKVALVLSGHVHAYDHLVRDGVHYITTGGGGGSLNKCRAPVDSYTERACEYHMVTVQSSGDELLVMAVGQRVIEMFTIGAD
jgi:hypothetical protein